MEVRPEIQIRAMIKSMVDVVLPAVDSENKMAQEQARLIIGTLGLVAERLPIAYRYDRDQLNRYVALSRELIALAKSSDDEKQSANELESIAKRGAEVLDRARAEPSELESAVFDLRAGVGQFLQTLHKSKNPDKWAKAGKLILSASKKEVERERALVIAMGFEAKPELIPPMESLLPSITA